MDVEGRAEELYQRADEVGILEETGDIGYDDPVDAAENALDRIESELAEEGELDPDTKVGEALREALFEKLMAGFS